MSFLTYFSCFAYFLESEPLCIIAIKVPRNTQFRAPVMTVLKINCTVIIENCKGNPTVSWCKIYGNDCKALNHSNDIKPMWKNTTQRDGIAVLTFLNISMDDAGSYRCKSQHSVSHGMKVTVTAHKENSGSGNQSNTSYEINQKEGLQWFWPYVSICGGLVGLVVIVITVSLFIIRCQGRKSARKETTTTIQYMKTQRSDPTTPSRPHHNSHPPSARFTSAYDTPPVRAGLHRDRPSDERLSANMMESKVCQNNVRSTEEEEENPLVYASLNHQAISRGPRKTVQQETEPSEYAAIRFR
ncbi:putative B- and T-lymphocyte attenuator-like [Triplophysa rosa]|uniref:B- and T-lymphocyte attenuator-like n=1 Tax=Triplophysa rosa TaxID=992332 RepID=A0A9W8C922_TRIRA|nr:putative B- and T-lymphocyte attenuator-like [Triplophysa rosa]